MAKISDIELKVNLKVKVDVSFIDTIKLRILGFKKDEIKHLVQIEKVE